MSIDPEDSLLEEALRSDLPSNEVAQRMRRRLLAAGVAIGNGVAATTGAAASAGAAGGLAVKVAGTSWGIKLGLAAVIAIPTVGLFVEGQTPPSPSVQAPSVRAPAPRDATPPAPVAVVAQPVAETPTLPERSPAPRVASLTEAEAAPAIAATAPPPRPSQVEFAPTSDAREPAPSPKLASTLSEETRLLDTAFAELAAGNRAGAAQWLREHETRFPSGLLVKERERAKARLSEGSRGE
jgi:hypothetical protein